MKLPEAYLSRMQKRLGTSFPAFLRAYTQPAVRGVRCNTLKLTREELLRAGGFADDPVLWEENGLYTDREKLGGLWTHHAGLFYAQEPSAMCAAPLLQVRPGEAVLDLCAAPGGKTTQLAAAMQGRGVLIANEYVYDRARVLSQNVERMGVVNCAVVSADPAALSARFAACFDKILVDAPCSGEGMFRKDAAAAEAWSEAAVERCAARQRAILDEAASMLRAGGRLVYSTCTFEEAENEAQAEAFVRRHPDFVQEKACLLLPHEVRGEGHFAAVFRREGGACRRPPAFSVRGSGAAERAWRDFAADFFVRPPQGTVTTLADGRMYLLPEGLPALAGIPVLRAGLGLGVFDGRRFTPAHALAMAFGGRAFTRFAELSGEEAERFLHGETLPCGGAGGWCVAGREGYPLGLGKVSGGMLKNHYPKGLRKYGTT